MYTKLYDRIPSPAVLLIGAAIFQILAISVFA